MMTDEGEGSMMCMASEGMRDEDCLADMVALPSVSASFGKLPQ